jgi:hypothetical protein
MQQQRGQSYDLMFLHLLFVSLIKQRGQSYDLMFLHLLFVSLINFRTATALNNLPILIP